MFIKLILLYASERLFIDESCRLPTVRLVSMPMHKIVQEKENATNQLIREVYTSSRYFHGFDKPLKPFFKPLELEYLKLASLSSNELLIGDARYKELLSISETQRRELLKNVLRIGVFQANRNSACAYHILFSLLRKGQEFCNFDENAKDFVSAKFGITHGCDFDREAYVNSKVDETTIIPILDNAQALKAYLEPRGVHLDEMSRVYKFWIFSWENHTSGEYTDWSKEAIMKYIRMLPPDLLDVFLNKKHIDDLIFSLQQYVQNNINLSLILYRPDICENLHKEQDNNNVQVSLPNSVTTTKMQEITNTFSANVGLRQRKNIISKPTN